VFIILIERLRRLAIARYLVLANLRLGYSRRRTVLGSLAEYQEAQCLASQNLEGSSYEAVGKAFPV